MSTIEKSKRTSVKCGFKKKFDDHPSGNSN